MNKIILLTFLFTLSAFANCEQLPAQFINQRIFAEVTAPKRTMFFFTDSGGGMFPFVYSDSAEELGLKIESTFEEEGFKGGLTTFPESITDKLPHLPEWKGKVRIFTATPNGDDEISILKPMARDGFLGASFYAAGKIWRLNYPEKKVWTCSKLPDTKDYVKQAITFKEKNGVRTTHQPRMEMEVMGKKYPMLFDTGATSLYSAEAMALLKLTEMFQPSSFIRESVARAWLKTNPKLRVIEQGDRFGKNFLIEVPEVKISGLAVGPVWFAARKDTIYDFYSKTYVNAHIDGAVGGNIFQHFDILADYPAGNLFVKKTLR